MKLQNSSKSIPDFNQITFAAAVGTLFQQGALAGLRSDTLINVAKAQLDYELKVQANEKRNERSY